VIFIFGKAAWARGVTAVPAAALNAIDLRNDLLCMGVLMGLFDMDGLLRALYSPYKLLHRATSVSNIARTGI
jgi:hypothetical protein